MRGLKVLWRQEEKDVPCLYFSASFSLADTKLQRMRACLENIEIFYLPDLFREIRGGERDIY